MSGNEAEVRRANAQHQEFQDRFRTGKCYLCVQSLDTFEVERPCIHWLLKPVGFKKWNFKAITEKYGFLQIEAFLRWVASEEAFARNINDLREESSGKVIEQTIRYNRFEWSFSCAESDYSGHGRKFGESQKPHYHFQMRENGKVFIKFNDFHILFSEDDLLLLETQRIAPKTLRRGYAGAPGMSELLREDVIEQVVMTGTSEGKEEHALLSLSTIIMADEGATISGDALAGLIEQAALKRVPVSSLLHKIPNASVEVTVSPGPGVVEQTPRTGRAKRVDYIPE